jgi:N-acetylglucosamine-6-phosphate deacetylase
MIISAPRIFMNGSFSGPAALVIEAGRIVDILPGVPERAEIRLSHGFLSPGLIDLHNNGAFGVDFCSATAAQWDAAIEELRRQGVTSLAPTIITAPFAELREAAGRVAAAMARHPGIIGLHLEGPFLAPEKAGAHRPDWLQGFTPENVKMLLEMPGLRVVTLAPELSGASDVIRQLVQAGITVSLGHTGATVEQMREAAGAGARLVTHVFNAQSSLQHRAPGAAGAALTDPRLFPCLIADGLHVDPAILQLTFAANPRAIAVTDSILVAGMAEGFEAEFGGGRVVLQNGVARRPDGTIAGGAITLNEGIRRLITAGVPEDVALAAATERPAEAMNLIDRGRIAVGCRADLVWWHSDFTVGQVWRAGKTIAPAALPRGTEFARPELANLDALATGEIIGRFLGQEAVAQRALQAAAPSLALLADAIAPRLQAGGRLFYAGAGTSGRLAFLDAVECGPTFGVGEEMLIPLQAGGPSAFLHAVEGAEDDGQAAIAALEAHAVTSADVLVGIAASGRTPFTLAAIQHARAKGALTGAIVNNPGTPIAAAVEIAVVIDSGAEIIAGSTRLSAGTTQKVALNILSSTVMIRLGKTYGPYMVDLRATNEKLKKRAIRMTATLAKVAEAEAEAALLVAGLHVKTAVVMLRLGVGAVEALEILQRSKGNLRTALQPQP